MSTAFFFDYLDIDECDDNTTCSENANCKNTIGSFICTCKTGYSGDGKTCTGKSFISFKEMTAGESLYSILLTHKYEESDWLRLDAQIPYFIFDMLNMIGFEDSEKENSEFKRCMIFYTRTHA